MTDNADRGNASPYAESLPGMLSISDEAFREIRSLVYDRFGINLTDQKRSLVVGRLQKVIKTRKLGSFEAYLDFLRRDESGEALSELVNRISTNHTFFYRESAHFDFLRERVLPPLIQQCRQQRDLDLRLWSAGCSTGEEPYLLAMLLMDELGTDYRNWQAGVLATDVSARALSIAHRGEYGADRLKELPDEYRRRFFSEPEAGLWQVTETVRREVTFRRFNLMRESFPFRKPFHVIFCRNVMIYFDQETRRRLVQRFYDNLMPGGYLFIGHSESLGRANSPFAYVQPAVYRRDA